jgi:hypothetical protein
VADSNANLPGDFGSILFGQPLWEISTPLNPGTFEQTINCYASVSSYSPPVNHRVYTIDGFANVVRKHVNYP